jgi:16S rRNA (cytidine1402-2'-O)-methyltransferase
MSSDSIHVQSHDTPLAPGLYLVCTPIGNLEDITLRALKVLRLVDRVACEDTRQTAKLLNHFGIRTATVSYHLHNEAGRAEQLMQDLRAGARVAVVSDAGTPGIADPGVAIVREAIRAGIAVFPIPGANAALSALIASGLHTENFTFRGFLPSKEGQRRSMLESVRRELLGCCSSDEGFPPTQVFYETPHRVHAALEDIAAIFGPGQRVVLARELTKLHEEFIRGTVAELLEGLRQRSAIRGEMVLLIEGKVETPVQGQGGTPGTLADQVSSFMREGLGEMDALKRVAKDRGLGKSEAYREWQRSRR